MRPVISLHRGDFNLTLRHGGAFGAILKRGATGLGVAPVAASTVPIPGGDGSTLEQYRHDEAEVFVPISVSEVDYFALRETRRLLENICGGREDLTEIRVTQPDGIQRSRFGYYQDGLDGSYDSGEDGARDQDFGITFRCPDPYWYGGEQNVTWFISQAAKPLVGGQGSFFPVVLQASVVAGEHEITVDGDAGATPRFSVAGPGEFVTITNKTTGQVFRYNAPLTGVLTVEGDDVAMSGTSDEVVWRNIPPGDEAPTLVQGKNIITVQMSDASPESTVRMSWRNVYRSGH